LTYYTDIESSTKQQQDEVRNAIQKWDRNIDPLKLEETSNKRNGVAIDEAKKTIHGIHELEIIDMTAKVDPNTGKITEYRAGVKISFAVEH
jgi:flavin-binding protein dodecin